MKGVWKDLEILARDLKMLNESLRVNFNRNSKKKNYGKDVYSKFQAQAVSVGNVTLQYWDYRHESPS